MPSASAASRARRWPPISSWSVSDQSSTPLAWARAAMSSGASVPSDTFEWLCRSALVRWVMCLESTQKIVSYAPISRCLVMSISAALQQVLSTSDPLAPIVGLSSERCDCQDHDLVLPDQVDKRELELPWEHPASSKFVRKSCFCKLSSQRLGALNRVVKATGELRTDRGEVFDFLQELIASLLNVPDGFQRPQSFRASA